MYDTGIAGYLTAACNSNREIDTKIVLTLPSGEQPLSVVEDIISYSINAASTAGKVFAPGNFVAGQLELSLNASSTVLSKIDFRSTPINSLFIEAGIRVYSKMVYVPMGRFYPEVDGVSMSDDGNTTVKATNMPPILKSEFNSMLLTLPCTISKALTHISSALGIDIVVDAASFPNLGVELDENFILVTTYREALMYIAETLGAFVYMGRHGEICLKRLFSGIANVGCTLDDNYLFSVNKQESSVKPFQYISIKASTDDIGVTHEVAGVSTECTYDIIDNPLTYGHPEDFLSGLAEATAFTEFYPAKVSFQGRPDLDLGDVIQYVYKGKTYILPICTHVFEYNGGFKTTVESIGSDVLKSSSVDASTKTQITVLRQNLSTLTRDLVMAQSQISEINKDMTQVSTILQTVEALTAQVSKVEGDLEKVSTLTQTAEQLRIDIKTVVDNLASTNATVANNQNTLLSYFDFQKDGLVIGISSSNIKLKLANNKVQFLKDDTTEVAYFSNGQLYVTDAYFIRSLVLGNFEFTPRSNGNLSLRRRG